jgi:hypothetical protein
VNPEVLDCDYYRFKELDAGAVNAFQNEYEPKYRAGRVLQAEGPARFDQFILNSIKMFKNNLMEFSMILVCQSGDGSLIDNNDGSAII